jgi:hypothetical protein
MRSVSERRRGVRSARAGQGRELRWVVTCSVRAARRSAPDVTTSHALARCWRSVIRPAADRRGAGQVSIASAILPRRSGWRLGCVASACYALWGWCRAVAKALLPALVRTCARTHARGSRAHRPPAGGRRMSATVSLPVPRALPMIGCAECFARGRACEPHGRRLRSYRHDRGPSGCTYGRTKSRRRDRARLRGPSRRTCRYVHQALAIEGMDCRLCADPQAGRLPAGRGRACRGAARQRGWTLGSTARRPTSGWSATGVRELGYAISAPTDRSRQARRLLRLIRRVTMRAGARFRGANRRRWATALLGASGGSPP